MRLHDLSILKGHCSLFNNIVYSTLYSQKSGSMDKLKHLNNIGEFICSSPT